MYMYTSMYRTEYLKDGQLFFNIVEAQYFLQDIDRKYLILMNIF